ncbi:RNA polymerase sigma-70 factor, ECF subfamily [Pseudonocardia thermophila]|uniref:RNA polymerase sigma-70 factor, ECF subfamily n=1 Tax=Pseudonocardia thermophila TaxID=1848 RepID=A0A1M6NNE9_PSETH|nr:sigma-70 family RNA polymerase sigma factor [Pseudonocardia thermophila]SHJ97250.1 RNA polymerase sigma-70 factor, ECF subfamily [Pseudonocardia thermophila]
MHADEALVHAIYSEHGRALLAYATRLTGDRAAAEDVVQETIVRAWRHPEVLTNGKGSTRGWLFTVARNIITDRARAKAARPQEVPADQDGVEVAPVQRDHAEHVVASVTVLEAMDSLSEDHRGVLEEIYFRGRSLAEAAAALGIPTGTVKSRSYYALRALRDHLTERSGEGVKA